MGPLLLIALAVGITAMILKTPRWNRQEFPRGGWPEGWPQITSLPIGKILGAITVLILFLIAVESAGPRDEEMIFFIGLVVAAVCFFWAWQREFVYLMGLRDDAFPGRYDKLIWAFALLVAAPIGVWFFRSYRLAHWPEPKAKPKPAHQGGHAVSDLF